MPDVLAEEPVAPVQEKPIALIVEDDPSTLSRRRRVFDAFGFQSIGVKTINDAVREFRSTPTIDIIITDINLQADKPDDRSGIELAREIRDQRGPGIPVMALSGVVDSLEGDDQKLFTESILKGRLNTSQLEAQITGWRDMALKYRRARAGLAKTELDRLEKDHKIYQPDVELLRDFLPGAHDTSGQDDDELTPDECLRRYGYRLRLIEAGFVMPGLEGGQVKTVATIPVWLRREGGISVAVLHGHSCVYMDDEVEEKALDGVLKLMLGYNLDFVAEPDTPLSQELQRLRDYLGKVFGEAKNANH